MNENNSRKVLSEYRIGLSEIGNRYISIRRKPDKIAGKGRNGIENAEFSIIIRQNITGNQDKNKEITALSKE